MSNYLLTRVPAGVQREQYMPLLLLADESEQQVRSYLQSGDLYAFSHEDDLDAAGVILVLAQTTGVAELKAVAVKPLLQHRGIGMQMILAVLDDLRRRGIERVVVGTANAAIGQLAFYQKAGFRLLRIERDFFSTRRGYPEFMQENDIRILDMVWMDQLLAR